VKLIDVFDVFLALSFSFVGTAVGGGGLFFLDILSTENFWTDGELID